MAKILRFAKDGQEGPGEIDAKKVWAYVLPRLDFPLPEFICSEIDRIVSEIWNASDKEINFHDCVEALRSLEAKDIMIPYARRETIVSLIFEYLFPDQ